MPAKCHAPTHSRSVAVVMRPPIRRRVVLLHNHRLRPRGEGARQVTGARIAAVSGYGMVEYRYGMCANAVVLEGTR